MVRASMLLAIGLSVFSIAVRTTPNDITHVVAEGVTKPLSIFSHATVYNGLVHVSCIQGFIPETFEFLGPDAASQAVQAFENLKKVLEQSGSGLDRILKMNLYFVDMAADFPAVNDVINRYFPKNPPARSSLEVSAIPRGARFVVDCVAAVNEGKETLQSKMLIPPKK